jgi:hypothetical protein
MRMTEWRGHLGTTTVVLEELLTRCAGVDTPEPAREERVLFTACEFWAAAMNRELRQHLATTADAGLRAAEESFAEIGALHVARALRRARFDLMEAAPRIPLRNVVTAIEDGLALAEDLVDDLIARFAAGRAGDRLRYMSYVTPDVGQCSPADRQVVDGPISSHVTQCPG